MKSGITICVLLICFFTGYTQPEGVVAIEDIKFDEQYSKRTIPRVTGKLLHISPEEISKTIISYTLVTLFGQVRKSTKIAADGSFKLELEYPLPFQQIWFGVGDIFYTGLYANRDLHVELDVKKIKQSGKELYFNGDGVRFLGTDGPLNDYMNNYVLFRRPEQLALNTSLQDVPRSRTPDAAKLLSAYGNIFDSLKMIQDDYIAKHPSPYAWILENERMSEYYSMICIHYWGHKMNDVLFDKMKQHKTYLISNNSTNFYGYFFTHISTHPANRSLADWRDVAKLPDLNDVEKTAIDSLRTAASLSTPVAPYISESKEKWLKHLRPRLQKIEQVQKIDKVIHFLDSGFSPPRADLIKLKLNESKDLVEQQAALERILPSMHTNWCKQVAKTEYANTTNKIATVNKALAGSGNSITAAGFGKPFLQTDFGASLYKISNMKAVDFLAKLRKSFPGKAIVFDLWATWCGPCLEEMPHSKKLQQDSKGLQVIFVYACTINSSNESKWKNKVAELKLPGVHFFIDEALDAELSQYFSFNGYPGYAFIDRNGAYKAGAIKRVSDIKDRKALAALVD